MSGTLPRVSLEHAVASLERDLILDALKSARGNVARAARLLDSSERVVAYKVRRLGLDPRPDGGARGAGAGSGSRTRGRPNS